MLEIKYINWTDITQELRDDWLSLVCSQNCKNISLCANWIESIAQARNVMNKLHVMFAYSDGQLSAVLPYLYTERKINGVSTRAIELAGNLASYHQDVIGSDWELLFESCFENAWKKWDVLIGVNLLADHRASQMFEKMGSTQGYNLFTYPGEISPYLSINADWEKYLAGFTKKTRGKINRYERRFSELGVAETRWYSNTDQLNELIDAILTIEASSWKTEADMAIHEGSEEYSYYRSLLKWLAENSYLVANVEYLDNKPVAYSLCYNANGKLGQMKTSFDDKYKEHSVGTIAIKHALMYAFENGATEFDFHGDRMPHKAKWAGDEREHSSYFLFAPTFKGRFLSLVKRLSMNLKSGK